MLTQPNNPTTMADASEATQAQPKNHESNSTFTSVQAALAAVEQGHPCLHLELTKPSHRNDYYQLVSAKPMTSEELAELVDVLPRLTQLKTLLLACMASWQLHKPTLIARSSSCPIARSTARMTACLFHLP